ncbi:MAG: MmcQ/YjbR family DNA-binding protein [Chloroflexi bacterium]|nr:MmcQ/YjbR family DNA-binding protein [Chloroflexota bacterium]MDA1240535.1 MmcQ/YjbR family DNA-binding protein [Chloroflexota bacterium]
MTDEHEELLARARAACEAFPEVSERLSHGSPAWFVREKRGFANLWIDGHHERDEPHLWLAAPPGMQEELIAADSATFFRPPYVGQRGWIGIRLGDDPDWEHIDELCEEAYRTVAPVTLIRQLDASRRLP